MRVLRSAELGYVVRRRRRLWRPYGTRKQTMAEAINLLAEHDSATGRAAFEEILVERVSPTQYKLLRSPALVLGVAADDVIARRADGRFDVLRRGKNLCVQIFSSGDLTVVEKVATQNLARLGGRLGGKHPRVLVYTVPVAVGFAAVEAVLNALVKQFPNAQWYFGNVYDPDDGVTPLNWWQDA